VLFVVSPMVGRQSTTIISSYTQHYDESDNTSAQLSISRRSPRRYAAVGAEDPSCRRSPPPQQQVPVDRRPSPLHLVASDASRRSPRDIASSATGRPGSGRPAPPLSPRDAAAIAAGADRRTTFASQKSFSYDVPSVQPPPQVHYRKQSEPIVGSSGSGQRQRQSVGGGGRLLPRLPISGTQLEHHINQLMKYRAGPAAMNLSVDAPSGPQQLNTDFVTELKELRRQISPSHMTTVKETEVAAPVIHPASGTWRSPVGSLISDVESTGRRQTFAGQKSLSYEVNQFVQYQPSGSSTSTERLRDYLDENEIKEFEIEDADGTGVSVWVPPATLSDRHDGTQVSRLGGTTAGRRASRVGGQRRAHFAEQRSFSCEAASSAPASTGHRGTQHVTGHADAVGRRYARESNLRLVRQSKTETMDAAVEIPATSTRADGTQSRRRDRVTAAETEAGGAVYRSHYHQTTDRSDAVAEHTSGRSAAIGYSEFDARGAAVATTGNSGVRYSGDSTERNRKSAKELRPLERHSSMASGVDERDVDVAASSSGRRHTTGQMRDHRYQDPAAADVRSTKNAAEIRRYGRSPVDGSYSAERSRGLDVDKKVADMAVDVHRKTSPRRVNVDAGKDTERTRPSVTQSGGGHATTYHSRRTSDLHDRDRYQSQLTQDLRD